MRLEETLVCRCAPTLAGLKAAGMFRYHSPLSDPVPELRRCDRLLAPRGVRVLTLGRPGAGVLVYVCRERQLRALLEDPARRRFLGDLGYHRGDLLAQLSLRLTRDGRFPHEVGLFLGYPLADVRGFLEHRGRRCLLTGCWKVYHDEAGARAAFAKFQTCAKALTARYRAGCPLPRLTAAGPPAALDRWPRID